MKGYNLLYCTLCFRLKRNHKECSDCPWPEYRKFPNHCQLPEHATWNKIKDKNPNLIQYIRCKCDKVFKAVNLDKHRKKCIGDISKVFYA